MKKFATRLMVMAPVVLCSFAFAGGDSAAGKSKADSCAGCHGAEGVTNTALWPNLAGQKEAYLVRQLAQFRDGTRKDPVMSAMAQPLSDQDILDLAAYYSEQDKMSAAKE